MNILSRYFIITLISLCSQMAIAEELLSTTTSWDLSKFSYPKKGKAEVTAAKIILDEGNETPYHCHPDPDIHNRFNTKTRAGELKQIHTRIRP